MVSFFAKEEKISAAELREILAMIETPTEKNNHLWKHFLFISQNHQG